MFFWDQLISIEFEGNTSDLTSMADILKPMIDDRHNLTLNEIKVNREKIGAITKNLNASFDALRNQSGQISSGIDDLTSVSLRSFRETVRWVGIAATRIREQIDAIQAGKFIFVLKFGGPLLDLYKLLAEILYKNGQASFSSFKGEKVERLISVLVSVHLICKFHHSKKC